MHRIISFASFCAVVGAPALATNLQNLVDQFAEIDSISIDSAYELYYEDLEIGGCGFGGHNGFPIDGLLQYDASGDFWNTTSLMNEAIAPDFNNEVAFDGQMHQWLGQGGKVLALSVAGDRRPGFDLPNLLFETVQFLFPRTEADDAYNLLLREVRDAADAADFSGLAWLLDVSGYDKAVIPGSTHEGVPYNFVVYAPPGQHHMPVRIDQLPETTGGVHIRTFFTDWDTFQRGDGGEMILPKRIMTEVISSTTRRPMIRMTMTITNMTINDAASLRSDRFTIDVNQAENVWLEEAGAFISP